MKKFYLISLFFIAFALVACINSNEGNIEQNDASNSNDMSQEVNLI